MVDVHCNLHAGPEESTDDRDRDHDGDTHHPPVRQAVSAPSVAASVHHRKSVHLIPARAKNRWVDPQASMYQSSFAAVDLLLPLTESPVSIGLKCIRLQHRDRSAESGGIMRLCRGRHHPSLPLEHSPNARRSLGGLVRFPRMSFSATIRFEPFMQLHEPRWQ